MNKYLTNLKKIEFVVTYACTGKCKHCSEGEHCGKGVFIDPAKAREVVLKVGGVYPLKTVMAFGGEGLLYPDSVFAIMRAARELDVPVRQVITNGYFTRDDQVVKKVARGLWESGVNDLLISVDAFHQETIPVERVMRFSYEADGYGIPIRISPAWLVDPMHSNPYNRRTRELVDMFESKGFSVCQGNIIFPEGNALKYLSEYFQCEVAENPYITDPYNVDCLSLDPNGDVLGENVYKKDILRILEEYRPF